MKRKLTNLFLLTLLALAALSATLPGSEPVHGQAKFQTQLAQTKFRKRANAKIYRQSLYRRLT
jgi:hypothetical protein